MYFKRVGSKAADAKSRKRPMQKRPMQKSKRPMLLKAADVCMKADDVRPKAADDWPKAAVVYAESGRCPLRTKAADVEYLFRVFWAKAADVP